jgi:hypothetical protein
MSPEEYQSRKDWIDRTASNDVWAKKIFNKVGILITSHSGNRPFIKACIETHKKLGLWMTLAYDNYNDPAWPEIDHDAFLPSKEVMNDVDLFLMPHHQVWGGVMYPWFWLMKWGVASMEQFEYIYCINGDFVLEKPEGFPKLMEMLGDADIMSYGPSTERSESTCFIAKTAAIKKIMQHFQDHFIPWDVYEKYTQEYGNAESRFARAIKELGLKAVSVEPGKCPNHNPCEQLHQPGTGTWYDVVGLRHIHGELGFAYRYKSIPPPLKYMDERIMGSHDLTFLKLYEETGDPKVLEEWWAKD